MRGAARGARLRSRPAGPWLGDARACHLQRKPEPRTRTPQTPPPSRTDWTRLVPPPVLTGHASSLLPYSGHGARREPRLRLLRHCRDHPVVPHQVGRLSPADTPPARGWWDEAAQARHPARQPAPTGLTLGARGSGPSRSQRRQSSTSDALPARRLWRPPSFPATLSSSTKTVRAPAAGCGARACLGPPQCRRPPCAAGGGAGVGRVGRSARSPHPARGAERGATSQDSSCCLPPLFPAPLTCRGRIICVDIRLPGSRGRSWRRMGSRLCDLSEWRRAAGAIPRSSLDQTPWCARGAQPTGTIRWGRPASRAGEARSGRREGPRQHSAVNGACGAFGG